MFLCLGHDHSALYSYLDEMASADPELYKEYNYLFIITAQKLSNLNIYRFRINNSNYIRRVLILLSKVKKGIDINFKKNIRRDVISRTIT